MGQNISDKDPMLHDRRILQGLTLRQAAPAWEAALVIRGLTQDQALRAA
jgi:hypothetical protein